MCWKACWRRCEGACTRRPLAAFFAGAAVAVLGGLIGLGGAEFRLPLLIAVFELYPQRAIRINLLISLATLGVSAIARLWFAHDTQVSDYVPEIVTMLAGGVIAAWIGAGALVRIPKARIIAVIACLLVAIAVCPCSRSPGRWCHRWNRQQLAWGSRRRTHHSGSDLRVRCGHQDGGHSKRSHQRSNSDRWHHAPLDDRALQVTIYARPPCSTHERRFGRGCCRWWLLSRVGTERCSQDRACDSVSCEAHVEALTNSPTCPLRDRNEYVAD